jgi:hypothetical protein
VGRRRLGRPRRLTSERQAAFLFSFRFSFWLGFFQSICVWFLSVIQHCEIRYGTLVTKSKFNIGFTKGNCEASIVVASLRRDSLHARGRISLVGCVSHGPKFWVYISNQYSLLCTSTGRRLFAFLLHTYISDSFCVLFSVDFLFLFLRRRLFYCIFLHFFFLLRLLCRCIFALLFPGKFSPSSLTLV